MILPFSCTFIAVHHRQSQRRSKVVVIVVIVSSCVRCRSCTRRGARRLAGSDSGGCRCRCRCRCCGCWLEPRCYRRCRRSRRRLWHTAEGTLQPRSHRWGTARCAGSGRRWRTRAGAHLLHHATHELWVSHHLAGPIATQHAESSNRSEQPAASSRTHAHLHHGWVRHHARHVPGLHGLLELTHHSWVRSKL